MKHLMPAAMLSLVALAGCGADPAEPSTTSGTAALEMLGTPPTTDEPMPADLEDSIESDWRTGMLLAFDALAEPGDTATVGVALALFAGARATEFQTTIDWLRVKGAFVVPAPGTRPTFHFVSEPQPTNEDASEVSVVACVDAALDMVTPNLNGETVDALTAAGPVAVRVRLRLEDVLWRTVEQVPFEPTAPIGQCGDPRSPDASTSLPSATIGATPSAPGDPGTMPTTPRDFSAADQPESSVTGVTDQPGADVIRDFRLGNQALRNLLADPTNDELFAAALHFTAHEWRPNLEVFRSGFIENGLRLTNPLEEPPLVVVDRGGSTGDEVEIVTCQVTPWVVQAADASAEPRPEDSFDVGPVIVKMRYEGGVWKRVRTTLFDPNLALRATCADYSDVIPFEI